MIIAASPSSQQEGLVRKKLGEEDQKRRVAGALLLVYRPGGFSRGGLKQGRELRK